MNNDELTALLLATKGTSDMDINNLKVLIEKAKDSDGFINAVNPHGISHYFESGALFITIDIEGITVPATGGKQQYEITNGVNQVRLFKEFFSTLADDYRVCIHEMPSRDLSSDPNATPLPTLRPNRTNLKDFPVSVYSLAQ